MEAGTTRSGHARDTTSVRSGVRQGAVRIVRETKKPVAQVARELGVCEQTLGDWVKKGKVERGETEGLTGDDRAELAGVAQRERRAADGARVSSSARWSGG